MNVTEESQNSHNFLNPHTISAGGEEMLTTGVHPCVRRSCEESFPPLYTDQSCGAWEEEEASGQVHRMMSLIAGGNGGSKRLPRGRVCVAAEYTCQTNGQRGGSEN